MERLPPRGGNAGEGLSREEPNIADMVEMGTEFEQMRLLDPKELAGISVAVVARYFPWWACVLLGKAGVTLSSVYLLYTSPWLELADTYFGQFNVRVKRMKSFSEVVSKLKGVHSLFLDASLLLSGRDSRTLGQEMGVNSIVSTSMFSRQPKEYTESRFQIEHAQVGGSLILLVRFLYSDKMSGDRTSKKVSLH
jgi:hypothetical protein